MRKDDFRPLAEGIGEGVFSRTYKRGDEKWSDCSERVVEGNFSLSNDAPEDEREAALALTKKGACLWAGRHLQHGDKDQPKKDLDLFANCSTSGTSFIMFYLLLCGSGVGRLYDSDVILTDWSGLPEIVLVLDKNHADYESCKAIALPKNKLPAKVDIWEVPDSRLGWAQILEKLEGIAFTKYKNPDYVFPSSKVYIDFSKIRKKGSPINGVQGKSAPGPKDFMEAILKISNYSKDLKTQKTKDSPWKQAMYVDDYLASCVLAGGSRRSSRIACKTWSDEGILQFVNIKSEGGLQTANNTVLVHKEFWDRLDAQDPYATRLFDEISKNVYEYGSGEPAILNQDMLEDDRTGLENLTSENIINKDIYAMSDTSKVMYDELIRIGNSRKYIMIVNPCGEINLHFLCGYCILFDLALANCNSFQEERTAGMVAGRALVRANKMRALYQFEVTRTNRIGISLTGLLDYALTPFNTLQFHDLLDYDKSSGFWDSLFSLRNQIKDDVTEYCLERGMNVPHTMFTIKPSGSVSKLYNLCEGAHMPAMKHYLRWVGMTHDDPLVEEYKALGYPTRKLQTYVNTTIVGFPTAPNITSQIHESRYKTASEVTPEEQYQWIKMLERFWIGTEKGSQVSYTLKFDPDKVTKDEFEDVIKSHHRGVKSCSWMIHKDYSTIYEYLPEEPISKERFDEISNKVKSNRETLKSTIIEQIDMDLVECQNGHCPL